jgi:hypothetical protein
LDGLKPAIVATGPLQIRPPWWRRSFM